MMARPGVPLLVHVAAVLLQLPSARGAEFHGEHDASHSIVLWRRTKRHHLRNARVQVEVGVSTQQINVTTPLEDRISEYIGVIGVGTGDGGKPQFQARVVFDTGSTNLWVASVLCSSYPCNAETKRRFYDPAKSTTQEAWYQKGVRADDKDIDVTFGTGELVGPLHVDTYRVGDIVVHRQPFAMIRKMNGDVFAAFEFEGILGLGFRSMSFAGIDPFFDRVIEQKLLPRNEFAFFFNADHSQPSALLWGGVDKDYYHGPIRMFPVVQAHYWAVELVDFRIGNQSLAKDTKRLIFDTGTTYFTAPTAMLNDIFAKIPEAPCSQTEKYEPLTFVLRGSDQSTYDLVVPHETYMIGGADGAACQPAFMRLDITNEYGPAMILGEVFMRTFFTVFSRGDGDVKNAKIGIAKAKTGPMPKLQTKTPSFLQPGVAASFLQPGVATPVARREPYVRRESAKR